MDPRYEYQARLRPPCPKLQTPSNNPAVASSFQSSTSSRDSLSSSSSNMSPSSRQTAAPLPSPSDSQQQPPQYYASFHPQAYQQQGGVYIQQQVQSSQTQQQLGGGRTEGYNCQPDCAGTGTTEQETARYMSEYGLVAEAAKRAEMAVLMRDLGGLDLRWRKVQSLGHWIFMTSLMHRVGKPRLPRSGETGWIILFRTSRFVATCSEDKENEPGYSKVGNRRHYLIHAAMIWKYDFNLVATCLWYLSASI